MRGNGEGKPVVALDIDGTLGNYHSNFLAFARKYFDKPGAWDTGQDNPGLPLWEWMGISQRDYRDAKLAYRQGGWKRWMPVYPFAADLTEEIRSHNAEVWLCTTRPYLRLDNVDPDTREWLRRNWIQYDALLFDPAHEEDGSKYMELCRQAGNRVAAILDDLPEMVVEAQRCFPDLQPILRDQPYNRHVQHRRASSLQGAWEGIADDLDKWRKKNV